MANTLAELIVKLSADLQDYDKKLVSATRKFQDFGNQITAIGTRLGAAITLPLVGFGVAAVKAASDLDALKRALMTVEKTTEGTNQRFEELREIAKAPGIGLEEAIRADVRLRQVGNSAERATKIMREFANAIAAAGGSREDFQETIRQFTQLEGRGKITMDNLKIILERMPQAAGILKQQFGTVNAEVLATKVSVKELGDVLLRELTNSARVTGGAKNAFENLRDTIKVALADVGESFLPEIEETVNKLSESAIKAGKAFKDLGDAQKEFVKWSAITAAGIPVLLIGFGTLATNTFRSYEAFVKIRSFFSTQASKLVSQIKNIAAALELDMVPALTRGESKLLSFGRFLGIAGIGTGIYYLLSKLNEFSSGIDNTKRALDGLKSAHPQWYGDQKQPSFKAAHATGQHEDIISFMRNIGANAPSAKELLEKMGVKDTAEELRKTVKEYENYYKQIKSLAAQGLTDPGNVNAAAQALARARKELKEFGEEQIKAAKYSGKTFSDPNIITAMQVYIDKHTRLKQEFLESKRNLEEVTKTEQDAALARAGVTQGLSIEAGAWAALTTAILGNAPALAASSELQEVIKRGGEGAAGALRMLKDDVDRATRSVNKYTEALQFFGLTKPGDDVDEAREKFNQLGEALELGLINVNTYLRGWLRLMEAMAASGEDIGKAKDQYEKLRDQLDKPLDKPKKEVSAFGRQVSTIMTDMSRGIAKVIVEGGKMGEVFKRVASEISQAIIRLVIESALKQLARALTGILDDLGKIGKAIKDVFGLGSSTGGGVAKTASSQTPGIGSASASGAAGWIGAISGAVSAVSGVIGNFQFAGMNKSLDLIEHETRYSQIHLQNILEKLNQHIPGIDDINLRLNELAFGGMGIFNAAGDAGLRVIGGNFAADGGGGASITLQTYGPVYGTGGIRQLAQDLVEELKRMGVKLG